MLEIEHGVGVCDPVCAPLGSGRPQRPAGLREVAAVVGLKVDVDREARGANGLHHRSMTRLRAVRLPSRDLALADADALPEVMLRETGAPARLLDERSSRHDRNVIALRARRRGGFDQSPRVDCVSGDVGESWNGPRTVRIGLLGCGNVGGALAALLAADADRIAARTGTHLTITRVAVRDVAKLRALALPDGVLTDDAASVVADPDIDVIVEVIGGIEPARGLILEALKHGKPVVTGNKELVATAGEELATAARATGLDLLFEASVAGGIPLLRPLRESLAGERIDRVMGIVNGTTNFILTRMTESGASYDDALAEAQQLGFAEPDPTADVEGFDAAAKAAIIATVAFGRRVVAADVEREGISGITGADIAVAKRLGYVVKLLAVARQHDDGAVSVQVNPALVASTHPLAGVRESFNAVFIEGRSVGQLMFYGRGAGGGPTASALLGDLLDAAHNLRTRTPGPQPHAETATIRPVADLSSAFYLRLEVADRPGVLAQVAGVFGTHGVSIRSMEQEQTPDGPGALLEFITHVAGERDVQSCLTELRALDAVVAIGSTLRVIT